MTPTLALAVLTGVWLGMAALGGAALAWLAKRIHPSLNFRRLWLVYGALLALIVAAVMAIGWW